MRLNAALSHALQAATVSGTAHHGYDYGNLRKVPQFKWERPFPYDDSPPLNMEAKCEVERTFKAGQWKLKDLQAPSPWAPAVETLLGWHPYVGSWEGADPGADEREFLIMEWTDIPTPVRDWISNQHANKDKVDSQWWLFGIFEKPSEGHKAATWPSVSVEDTPPPRDEDRVVLFAPAAMYEILPLWVAEGSECEGQPFRVTLAREEAGETDEGKPKTGDLSDLNKYSSHAKDESVIAWPIGHQIPDTKLGKKDITFKVKAFHVVETEHGRAWKGMWEKLHMSVRRQERKVQREERRRKKDLFGEESHVRDEL